VRKTYIIKKISFAKIVLKTLEKILVGVKRKEQKIFDF
jgi:hypothetical protein